MYRDMIYTSLAKANPAFLSRLSAYNRVEEFIDSFSEFAGDAHFQIERQIIDQYTNSEEYNREKGDLKKVNSTLKHIDDNVMRMIPDLIEQALTPGSEMMEQLEREEDEIEYMRDVYRDLFRDREMDREDSGAGIIIEEGGLEKLDWDMPEDRSQTLESFFRHQLKLAQEMNGALAEKQEAAGSAAEGSEVLETAADAESAGDLETDVADPDSLDQESSEDAIESMEDAD